MSPLSFASLLHTHANQRLRQLRTHLIQLSIQRRNTALHERLQNPSMTEEMQEEQLLFSKCELDFQAEFAVVRLTLAPDHIIIIRCNESTGNFSLHWATLLPLQCSATDESLITVLAEEQQRLRTTLQPLASSLLRLRREALHLAFEAVAPSFACRVRICFNQSVALLVRFGRE